jgi:hypothetical protein
MSYLSLLNGSCAGWGKFENCLILWNCEIFILMITGSGLYCSVLNSNHPALPSTLPIPLAQELQAIVTHPNLNLPLTRSESFSDVTLRVVRYS